jgi:hypothetical protein
VCSLRLFVASSVPYGSQALPLAPAEARRPAILTPGLDGFDSRVIFDEARRPLG